MPVLVLKETGDSVTVAPENLSRALASGLYEAPAAGTQAQVQTPAGLADVPVEQLGQYQTSFGDPLATTGSVGAAERGSYLDRAHGGLGGAVGTFAEQAVDTATLGGYGYAADLVAGDQYTKARGERLEANPIAGTAGTVVGAVAPALLSGGAGAAGAVARATPAGAAARLAEAIVAKGAGRGLAAETAAAAAGYGVEGALFGSGHVLAETVLQDKELSAEAFVAGATEGALWGGGAGAAGALLSRGTRFAKNKLDDVMAERASVKDLAAEHKAAAKAAEVDAKALAKAKLENEKHLNRVGMEELRQEGRLKLVGARGEAKAEAAGYTAEQRLKLEEYRQGGRKALAQIGAESRAKVAELGGETKLAIADKRLEQEVARAEARVAVSRAKLDGISERLAVEQERSARAKLVMDGRLELADTYTAGWRKAADSREAVAASKLEAAGIGADARTRVGMADALVRSGRSDAGLLVEEMIPARLRTPKAIEAAKADVVTQTARLQSGTDDLVRQADEMMALNPAAADDLRAFRDKAAEASSTAGRWTEKQSAGGAVDEVFQEGVGLADELPDIAPTPEEYRAVDAYTGADYKAINHHLRGYKERWGEPLSAATETMEGRTIGEIVDDLDNVIARSPVPRNTLMFRGEGPSDTFQRTFKVGETIDDGAYWSTSLDRSKAEGFSQGISIGGEGGTGVLYEIEVPAGMKAAYATKITGGAESEFILPRGQRYEIRSVTEGAGGGKVVRVRPERPPANDFADGFTSIRGAEQAQHDLAQAMRMHSEAAGLPAEHLDEVTAGMDEAVGKTDEIVEQAMAKQVDAATGAASPSAGTGAAGDAAGIADLLIGAVGLPNADDIPVIGPVLGAYLKFRAAHGVLSKLGIRLPGPVGKIAQLGTQVQNKASEVVAAVISRAPAAAMVVERAAPSLSATLSRPLWEPVDDGERHAPGAKADPLRLYKKRIEELDRAMSDPDGTRQKIIDSIPAPPTVVVAIADAVMRQLEYLHGLVDVDPRPPMMAAPPVRANRVEMQRFAEAKRAVEYPVESIRDFIDGIAGSAVVDAVKTVFPRLFASMQEQLIEKIADVDEPVSFPRLVRAAMVFDVPLTHATTPAYGAARQAEYAAHKEAAQQPAPSSGGQLRISQNEQLGQRAMR